MEAWEAELRDDLANDSLEVAQRLREFIANERLDGGVLLIRNFGNPCGCVRGLLFLARNPDRAIDDLQNEIEDVSKAARHRYSWDASSITALEDFVYGASGRNSILLKRVNGELLRVIDDVIAERKLVASQTGEGAAHA